MKTKHFPVFFTLLLLVLCQLLQAQPTGNFDKPTTGKKFVHYNTTAKKHFKKGDIRFAASNAIQALLIAERKNHLKKGQEIVAEVLPVAIETTIKQVEQIRQGNAEYSSDNSIVQQLELVSILMEIKYIKEKYEKIPTGLLSGKKGLDLRFDIPDYPNSIEQANLKLADFLSKGAEDHYKKAQALEMENGWRDQYRRAKHLEKSLYYSPGFKDAQAKLQDAKVKGKCIMTLGKIVNNTNRGNFSVESIRNGIKYDANQGLKDVKKYRYFKLIETHNTNQVDANVELSLKITNVYQKNNTQEPSTRDHKKKVDDVEIKATSTHYYKSSTVYIEGTYFITDLQTGEVLETDHFQVTGSWSHEWARISGNKEAVKKSTKYKATLSDKPFPSLQEMIDSTGGGALRLTKKLGNVVQEFAKSYT